jgi:LuxR family maltose regulon positive regulatory protein
MIKAPAGFGKTSLAAAWSQELQQSGNAVGWLTIDRDDDEPATFIFYLCHALQRACDTVGTAAIDLIGERFLLDSREPPSARLQGASLCMTIHCGAFVA